MLLENGYPAIRDGSESYDIEAKYGFSLEENVFQWFLFHKEGAVLRVLPE